jgi:hypothetical protein
VRSFVGRSDPDNTILTSDRGLCMDRSLKYSACRVLKIDEYCVNCRGGNQSTPSSRSTEFARDEMLNIQS